MNAQELAEEIKRLAEALEHHPGGAWVAHGFDTHMARKLLRDAAASIAAPQPAERVMWPATEMFALKPIGFASVADIQRYAETLTISTHLPGVRDVAVYTKDQLKAAVAHERNTAPQPAERKPLTEDEIVSIATKAVADDELPWLGFAKDANGEYRIPNLTVSDFKLIRLIERAHGIGIPPKEST